MLNRSFDNLRVLDLTHALSGPFCSMILGDLGAEVIKIEAPGGSDEARMWGPPFLGNDSAYFLCVNRNKKSVTINLKTGDGRKLLYELVNTADVLIENFRPGTTDKLGINYDAIREINPRLIYCSISGFGQTSVWKEKAGYDFIVQALSGLMSITGTPHTEPTKFGVSIGDITAGMYSAMAILAALYVRDTHTQQGQYIDISLMDSLLSLLTNVGSNYLISGEEPQRIGNTSPNVAPYQMFKTSDGEIVLAVGNDKQFTELCKCLNVVDLYTDDRFRNNAQRVRNRRELEPLLTPIFSGKSSSEWERLLNQSNIPCGIVSSVKEALESEHVHSRDLLVSMDHPEGAFDIVGSPIKMSELPIKYERCPTEPGVDNESVLRGLGLSAVDVRELRDKGII